MIEEVLKQGKHVIFATGRCLAEMKEYLDEFPEMKYMICENGACVYDLHTRKEIYRRPVSRELTEQVIRAVEKEDVLVSFFIGNKAFMNVGQGVFFARKASARLWAMLCGFLCWMWKRKREVWMKFSPGGMS